MVVSFGVSGADGAMNLGRRRRNRDGGANGANDQVGVEPEEVSSLLLQELAIASPCMSFGDGTQA
jgi:hypothetical protein